MLGVCSLAARNEADKLFPKRTPCPNSHAFTVSSFGCSPSLRSATTSPHFHAYYGEHVAVFSISPVALIIGFVPQRQQRLVEAWAELHEEELLADWTLLEQGRKPSPITPLV